MLIDKNWMDSGKDRYELTCGEFASQYFIDSRESYKARQAAHKAERVKFQRYVSKSR